MKNIRKFLAIIILISIIGCENNDTNSESIELGNLNLDDEEQPIDLNKSELESKQENQIDRKFIKTGQIEFESENLSATRDKIFKAIIKFNGYISSENEYKNSNEISDRIVIKVPADNFDKLVQEITSGVERFDRKEIYIEDVTEEFLDFTARLKTKKELENRYLEILKQANSVTQILEVEKQIGELRSEIESFEGRLKFLKSQVSFSTLTIRIYEPLSKQTEFGKKFKDGFKNGWDNLILFFVALVNIWPFLLIIFAILILIRVWNKRKRSRK